MSGLLAVCLLAAGLHGRAQAAPLLLTSAQKDGLVQLVKTDREASSRFSGVLETAAKALARAPRPIERIRSEGLLQGDPLKTATNFALTDMKAVEALGYAYLVTGEPRYADKTREYLLAWARLNQGTGDPIDETNLDSACYAYDLTRATFSADERRVTDSWLANVAQAEIASRRPGSTKALNNWNSHRLKIVGLIGFLLSDQRFIDFAVRGYKEQVQYNLRPSGSSYDFEERDALHYHVYDLEPLLALAAAAQVNGVELYHYVAPSGASLEKSVQFLVPFASGTQTHAEFVNSKVEFDRRRAKNGEKGYQSGTLWLPVAAKKVFEYAASFNPAYRPLLMQLEERQAARYPSWTTVINAARHLDGR